MIEEQLKAFDSAIESARLLGRAESRKERGSYTEDDARFEVSMHQSIAKHRAAMLASSPPAPQQIGKGVPDVVAEVIGCFQAAEDEGLHEALTNTTDERLKDLIERRLMYALYACQSLASAPPAPQQEPLTDEHVCVCDGSKCWCDPELNYKDPDTGVEVWVHRSKQ